MSYDVNKLAKVNDLKSLALRVKSEIETAISDLPTEMFLDQTKTAFVPNFAFSQAEYPGATDPNLDGKPVMVLAVKGIDHNNNDAETTTYSFLDMETLVDTYHPALGDSAKVLTINGYTITFNVSASAGNILTVNNDGLYATTRVTGAVNGNVTSFDANGAPEDSGIAKANILQVSNVALDEEVAEMINEVFGA